jgi:hypothetical protein
MKQFPDQNTQHKAAPLGVGDMDIVLYPRYKQAEIHGPENTKL